MEEIIKLPSFKLIGISVKTSNDGGKAGEDIAMLWKRFYEKGIMSLVPNKISSEIYCLYTRYQSDHRGEYTCLLGCKVSSFDDVPSGCSSCEVPATSYLHYQTIGASPQNIVNTWERICASDINRAYIADFDIYGSELSDPLSTVVDTYVSVR